MSALSAIQRQLQHLNDHIEESHATLDSLESFTRNKDRLSHQLRTIREDLILLKRSLAWLARFTNLARALTPNPFTRNDDFAFHPSIYFPPDDGYFMSDLNPTQQQQQDKSDDELLKDDFQTPLDPEPEDYPPLSNERFRERMLQTAASSLPRLEENRTFFSKDVEEEKQITDEEIAYTLPGNVEASFQKTTTPDAKTSASFQMSSFLLPPFRFRNPETRSMRGSFGHLPNFEIYRRFRDLGEVPLEKHGFFDTPKSFRSSFSSFDAPLR